MSAAMDDPNAFVLRGELRSELREVKSDVRDLSRDFLDMKATLAEQGRKQGEHDDKLNLIVTTLDTIKSIKHWVGWVLVVSTSSAAVTIVPHLSGHIK